MSVLAALSLALGSGCVTTQQSAQAPGSAPEAIAQTAIERPKDGAKRSPLPGTVVALAIIKERDAENNKNGQQMKLYDEARLYFQDALRIDPKYRDAIQGLARVYTGMNDFEHALPIYQKALEKTPQDHGLWFDMGMCYSRKQDLAQALSCFQKALNLDPENRQYMKTLGFVLARTGQNEQSLALLTRALGAPLAHYNLARMMDHLGQTDQCRHHLRLALQLNPNLAQASDLLAALESPRPSAPRATLAFSTE